MGQQGQSMLMNPMGSAQPMMDTLNDPQKLLAGFVGPTSAGIKPPSPKGPDLKKPGTTAITPTSTGDLQSRFSIGAGGGGGSMMDEETMRFLQMLSQGR